MGVGTILLIILVLLLIGAMPAVAPHSRSWGYGPSGIAGRGADHRSDRCFWTGRI